MSDIIELILKEKSALEDIESQIRQDQKEKCAKAVTDIHEHIFFDGSECVELNSAIGAIMEAD